MTIRELFWAMPCRLLDAETPRELKLTAADLQLLAYIGTTIAREWKSTRARRLPPGELVTSLATIRSDLGLTTKSEALRRRIESLERRQLLATRHAPGVSEWVIWLTGADAKAEEVRAKKEEVATPREEVAEHANRDADSDSAPRAEIEEEVLLLKYLSSEEASGVDVDTARAREGACSSAVGPKKLSTRPAEIDPRPPRTPAELDELIASTDRMLELTDHSRPARSKAHE